MLLVKQNEAGREMSREDIRALLMTLVDVVIQFGVEGYSRYIKEIWYGPARSQRPAHC
jgi:type IV secretion system protein VirB11